MWLQVQCRVARVRHKVKVRYQSSISFDLTIKWKNQKKKKLRKTNFMERPFDASSNFEIESD